MSRLKHLSNSVSKLSDKMFERKFVTLGRLLQHWSLIVGEDLARLATPVKLTYRKKGKEKYIGLIIATDSSQAMRLHYRKELILAKINQVLGNIEISELKFVDQSIKAPAQKSKLKKKKLTEQQEEKLHSLLSRLEDEDLKESLKSFGKSIFVDTGHANQDR